MQFQRVSPTRVLVMGPVASVREAAWHALANERVVAPIIDVGRNLVSGSQGDGILTVIRVVTARFEADSKGIVVSFESKPVLGGRDMGARGREKKLANALERVLAADNLAAPDGRRAPIASGPAPIADPSGAGYGSVVLTGQPVYGTLLAPKRGATLLTYSLVNLFCCQILAPLSLMYGVGALRDYKRQGDPGDKGIVLVAITMSVLATALLAAVGIIVTASWFLVAN